MESKDALSITKMGGGEALVYRPSNDGPAEVLQIQAVNGPSRYTAAQMIGRRVVRGPDWRYGDQDHLNGVPCVGIVVSDMPDGRDYPMPYDEMLADKLVIVMWDNKHDNVYRYGKDNLYDVVCIEDAPKPQPKSGWHRLLDALKKKPNRNN